jgi:ribonucleotide reductase alpha subunit
MAYRRLGRFNKKAPTQVKVPYMVFACHEGDFPLMNPPSVYEFYKRPEETFVQVAAIDIGVKNTSIAMERRWSSGHIDIIMLVNINFTVTEEKITDTIYYTTSIEHLTKYLPYFEMCQYILVESQLPINYDAVRMSQHIITFLMMNLKNKGCKPMICEIDTYFKSRIFDAPKKMKKPELKKWCIQYALNLLEKRKDTKTIEMIKSHTKKDDLCDTLCYCEGWFLALEEGIKPIKLPSASK